MGEKKCIIGIDRHAWAQKKMSSNIFQTKCNNITLCTVFFSEQLGKLHDGSHGDMYGANRGGGHSPAKVVQVCLAVKTTFFASPATLLIPSCSMIQFFRSTLSEKEDI